MTATELGEAREAAESAALAAGKIVARWYATDFEVREKGRDNPVTQADLEADQCIRERLTGAFPSYGWLSEETADSPERLTCERVWIVDPLDGTKEFIKRIPELAVCIALSVDGEPLVGVEYNPIREELYSAARGLGITKNGAPVTISTTSELAEARVLASRSEIDRGEWEPYASSVQITPCGSVAYKLARIAAGEGDATFSLTPKHEWDVCAGAALLLEAGGRMTNSGGDPIRFNAQRPWLPGLIATNAALYEPIRGLIARVSGK